MMSDVRVESFNSVSIASFTEGQAVVFLRNSGDVLTCSSKAVDEWVDSSSGELADMLIHLGWRPGVSVI
jgi:hypothetical protein